jgi:hypothetical protein
MWVSIKTLKDEYGVVFDEDKLGMPKVRLITNDRIQYNGIDSFAFLHYLV